MSRGWLIVFAKAPRPGLVKTRMSPPLSLEQAAELYGEMLADVLVASGRFARDLGLDPVLAFHPPDAARELVHRAPPGFRLHAQCGADLGERMAHAAREAAAAGVDRILIRGSDSPTLEGSCFEEILAGLDAGDDLVLTPDQDGGYATIGLRRPEPRLFQVEMSTASVFEETLARAASLGLRAGQTRPGFDLDTAADLALLDAWLCGKSPSEIADLCPRTVGFLASLPPLTVL
jgi:rSAM/selenodomain-associated transferase 1